MPASTPTLGQCSNQKFQSLSKQLANDVLPVPDSPNSIIFFIMLLFSFYDDILLLRNYIEQSIIIMILSNLLFIIILISEPKQAMMSVSKAVVGGGCFWCVEAVLQRLRGVKKVESGYAGGHVPNPTYQAVCKGTTGHAEVVRVQFDNKVISYHDLLFIFMNLHDPTTLNRQGYDQGTQYRSIIMYETQEEKQAARKVIEEVQAHHKDKIVTQLTKLTQFYPAQQYHQNYYNQNPNQGYCRGIIRPKIEKLENLFKKYLQKEQL